jgi:hypothetical protein
MLSNEPLIMPDNVGITLDPIDMAYILVEAHMEDDKLKSNLNFAFSIRIWTTG